MANAYGRCAPRCRCPASYFIVAQSRQRSSCSPGAAVRVTGCDIGCPNWPQCHENGRVAARLNSHAGIEPVDLVDEQLRHREHWAERTGNVGGRRTGSLSRFEASQICHDLTGRDVKIGAVGETRAGDARCYLSDCSALYEHTDWRPCPGPRAVLADIFGWITDNEALVRDTVI
jgi:hypothetical protein